MTDLRLPLALALALALSPAAHGQTAGQQPATDTAGTEEAPVQGPNDLSLGEDVDDDETGTTYVAAEHGDWSVRCIRTGLEADPCELYQLLQDDQGNSVAEISLFNLPPGQQAAAGATIVTPLETLLTAQITLRVDGGQAKRYPFTFCAPIGCFARVGFTEAEINAFRRGNQATLVIVPAMLPDEQVALQMSLRGFTAGYEAVRAANAAAEKAAEAAEAAAGEGN
ncbi:MAG: invasion associated locus B family protein [Gemmobacter sp.]